MSKQIITQITIVLDWDKMVELGCTNPKDDVMKLLEDYTQGIKEELPEFDEVISVSTKVEEIDV